MDQAHAEREPTPHCNWLITPLLLVFVLLSMYVLSFGPYMRLLYQGKIPILWDVKFGVPLYRPIWLAAERIPGGQAALKTYLNVWVPP